MCLPNSIHKTLCAHPWISTSTQTQTCWQINMLVCYSECLVRLHVFSLINWISIPYFCCFFVGHSSRMISRKPNAKKHFLMRTWMFRMDIIVTNVPSNHISFFLLVVDIKCSSQWIWHNEWIFQQSQPPIYTSAINISHWDPFTLPLFHTCSFSMCFKHFSLKYMWMSWEKIVA